MTPMPVLKILSGGAAQGLVAALAPEFEAQTGCAIEGEFGAVGGMAAKLRSGYPADLLILTRKLIEELEGEGRVERGTSADVGRVETAIAVRAGDKVPDVSGPEALKQSLLGADAIFCPDPERATAGIHFARVLEVLGIRKDVASRLRAFPNGATAMRELAAAQSKNPIGCTQVTEILNTPGVTLVAPLPKGCDLATTYTAAICSKAESGPEARRLASLLTAADARRLRARLGFS
jgi:molybdate transport system substrate-binding protein